MGSSLFCLFGAAVEVNLRNIIQCEDKLLHTDYQNISLNNDAKEKIKSTTDVSDLHRCVSQEK